MIALKKIIENTVANSQLNEIPSDIQPVTFFTWDPDISSDKDWDDFVGGQLVAHTYWDKGSFKGMVDVTNLEFGASPDSYYGMLNFNEQITIYTSEYRDLNGKFITIGDNISDFYYAISFELNNFKLKDKRRTKSFYGKVILVNIQKFLDNQFNDANEAPVINITAGKLNETITIPVKKQGKKGEVSDPNVIEYEEGNLVIKQGHSVEIFLPNPAIMIGGGVDFVSNNDRKGNAPADLNRLIQIKSGSTKPKKYPVNPYYSIAPAQWNIPSIDNYGFTHPADRSNVIKTLMATQSLGSAAKTGLGVGSSSGIIGSTVSAIGSAVIGTAQKHFGDKGTLANSGAVNSSFLQGEGDPIKIFIQGDGTKNDYIDNDGYLNIKKLEDEHSYLEINQANGEFGKYGKSMSPSNNNLFNTKDIYRSLGIQTITTANQAEKIPALATPFAGSGYEHLIINDKKINDIMKTGAPRLRVNSGDVLKPMVFPEGWDVYVRNMFFRPDPYSFWNWPVLMPAEIGIWDPKKPVSIAYDISAIPSGDTLLSFLGTPNTKDNSGQRPKSYWNKTITVSQITDNDLYDPNKTFSSFRYEFEDGALNDLYQIQMTAITSSTIGVKVLDENNEVIREHKFNSQGKNVGTSASWGTVVQL